MIKTKEFKASNAAEAIEIGLKEMNLSRENAEITIIREKASLFSKALVSITRKEIEEQVTAPELLNEKQDVKTAQESKATEVVEKTEKPVVKEEKVAVSEKALNECLKYVNGLLEKMNIQARGVIAVNEDESYINIEGEDAKDIVGYRGETLDAIQYLAMFAVGKNEINGGKITIDTMNYRAKRKMTLEKLAMSIARKVKESRREHSLEPMNPYERRIIHTALQNNRFVESESDGEGNNRHIVIKPKKLENSDSFIKNESNERFNKNGKFNNFNNGDRTNRFENKREDKPVVEIAEKKEVEVAVKAEETSDIYQNTAFAQKGFGKTRSFGYSNKKRF